MCSKRYKIAAPFDLKKGKGWNKRREIIEAALESLATVGIDKTTYDVIANKLNTSKGHISYYFPCKDDIFIEGIKYITSSALEITDQFVRESKVGEESLIQYVKSAFFWANNYPTHAKLITLLYYLSLFRDDCKDLNDKIKKNNEKVLTGILKEVSGLKLHVDELSKIAMVIQHTIIGELIATVTTINGSYDLAERKTIDAVLLLINSKKGQV